jgi:hypothetical protein
VIFAGASWPTLPGQQPHRCADGSPRKEVLKT